MSSVPLWAAFLSSLTISAFWSVQSYINFHYNLVSFNIIIGVVGFVSVLLVFIFLFVPSAFVPLFLLCYVCVCVD